MKGLAIPKLRKVRITRKGWIRKLDKLVSEIVILRDKRCVVCGTLHKLTCGHLFSRIAYNTRWNLTNCHAQCLSCNFRHEHDAFPYMEWFRKKFGQAALNRLHRKYETISHFKDYDLEKEYKQLLKVKERIA